MFSLHTLRRILSIFLAFLLLLLPLSVGSAANTAYSVPGNHLDVYLRVFIGPSSASTWIGHFDLRINGNIRFRGKTFKNPVFSYGVGSVMYVFNAADTKKVYAGHSFKTCRAYTWHFRIDKTASLGTFLKYLDRLVASARTPSECPGALVCKFKKSSRFSSYRASSVNCFTAAATFLKKLGDPTLWKIYKNAYDDGPSYLPRPFVRAFKSHLKRIK